MFSKNQRKDAYSKSTAEMQDFISSNESTDIVNSVGSKYNLTIEQKNFLEDEILYVLLGLQPQTILPENLKNQGSFTSEQISVLFQEIKEKVFNKIEQLLPPLVTTQPELEAPHDMLIPQNLPTETALEEKLVPLTKKDTPPTIGEKDWEERKKALGESSVMTDYKGNDPYREPLS